MIVVVGGQWCHFPPGGALHLPLHPHRAAGSNTVLHFRLFFFFISLYFCLFQCSFFTAFLFINIFKYNI